MRRCRYNVSLMLKSISRNKNSVLPIEKFPFLVLARNTMFALLSNFLSVVCQVVGYGRLKTKENFNPLAGKSGRGRL